jgi:hypothetical protein
MSHFRHGGVLLVIRVIRISGTPPTFWFPSAAPACHQELALGVTILYYGSHEDSLVDADGEYDDPYNDDFAGSADEYSLMYAHGVPDTAPAWWWFKLYYNTGGQAPDYLVSPAVQFQSISCSTTLWWACLDERL